MPHRVLLELQEYERLEPFGAWRDNWHSAMIATMIANALKKKGRSPYGPTDFMYRDADTETERQDREFHSRLKALAVKK